jgi:PPM family protein phosphatase
VSTINHAGLTDIGRVRTANEDRWFADSRQGIYLVADGIGGSAAGGLASQIVAEVLPRLLRSRLRGIKDSAAADITKQVSAALAELSERLRDESQVAPGLKGIGSTVVLAFVWDWQTVVAHMGDSRAYLFRAGRLEQLTKDHTIAQLLVDRGELAPGEAASHPTHGRLTRFVGMGTESLPETKAMSLTQGDQLLLCSDGLTGMLSDQQILAILSEHAAPEEACRQLIAAANEAGGKDNITALVVTLGNGTPG